MISIITITYNRKPLLEKTIESVQNQIFDDFEHIIIDDGSTDGTREFIESLNNPRIRYIYSEKIGRLSILRNMGLDIAKGEICALLDSDDLWKPNYLKTIKQVFDNENVLSVVSNAVLFNPQSEETVFRHISDFKTKGNLLKQKLLNDKFVIYPSVFSFKNKRNFRFNTSFRVGDSDLFLKILSEGKSVILPEAIVYIRKHKANMSSDKSYDSSFIQAYFEEFASLKYLRENKRIGIFLYRKAYSKYALKLSRNLLSLSRKKEAQKYLLQSFFMYPLNYRALAKFVLTIFV